ncbi:dihydrolipoyl dehydrogenase [Paremcibacter congregatus]|uniref:dihydrolipoyl dehydrogenase n=1 Tax=Paremcibacter congregatus TaxID=2043170 RepID=UPI003A8CDBC5
MSVKQNCKLLVVGAGPGGYVAAIRAGQLGIDTIIVEGDKAGGTCLIRGCIPSKALIHAADKYAEMSAHAGDGHLGIKLGTKPELDFSKTIAWKDGIVNQLNGGVEGLLKKAKVKQITGWATFKDAKTCDVETADGIVTITAEHVILATGSKPTELPFLPFGEDVISSTEALDLQDVPKRLVVVGAGYIGLELGIAYRKLGADVTFIEAEDRILATYDKELTRPILQSLKKLGITTHLGAKASGWADNKLSYTDKDGAAQTIAADKLLVTVGRKPNTTGWGLENMAVDMLGPFVKIDSRCHTSMKNVWAIGDITGEPMLAHRASAQGEVVAELIAGKKAEFNPNAIAAVCFTDPEIIAVGQTAEDAKKVGIETVVGKFPLMANGRALTMEAGEGGGFVRITARKDNHLILGIHAVGPHVSELSGEFALALEMSARLEDIAGTIHVHPTMTESFAEASLAALGHAIHI